MTRRGTGVGSVTANVKIGLTAAERGLVASGWKYASRLIS